MPPVPHEIDRSINANGERARAYRNVRNADADHIEKKRRGAVPHVPVGPDVSVGPSDGS